MDVDKPYGPGVPDEDRYWRPDRGQLALHRWTMGQVLRPEHFRVQENALLEHIDLRTQLAGLPSYGVALLPWSDAQIRRGELSLTALTVVMPSGLLIDYPGNAELTVPRLKPPSKPETVWVYLYVRDTRDAARDRTAPEGDKPKIERAIYDIEICAEQELKTEQLKSEQERMTLAKLEFTGDAWRLGPYTPPLLRIGSGTTPFLRDVLERAVQEIVALESDLIARGADSLIGADQLSAVRRSLTSVYRLRAVLADHGYGGATRSVARHPYHLFAALRDFYFAAVAPRRALLERGAGGGNVPWDLRYEHDDLRGCFEKLVRELGQRAALPALVSPRLMFHREDYWFVASPFPDELRSASKVFLLLESQAGAAGAGPPPPADIKLASRLRATEVYTKALEGVPLRAPSSRGFAQTFGDRATVVELVINHPEWQYAVAEGALCFAARAGLENVTAALYWHRSEHG